MKSKEFLERLQRRMKYLDEKIQRGPNAYERGDYDIGELHALQWAIKICEKHIKETEEYDQKTTTG